MDGAQAAGMDAVLFSVKRAHLGAERFGRRMLAKFGLTPARFDLMKAASQLGGVKQSALRRQLGVVRSAVCEMLAVLESIGFVRRARDREDARTWIVTLTRAGRDAFERAHDRLVDSGDVTVQLDAVLADRIVEIDASQQRYEYVQQCLALAGEFGNCVRGPDLYWWNFEDFYGWFADVDAGSPTDGVPFVAEPQ